MNKKPRWLRSVRDFLSNLRYYLYDETHTRRDYYEDLFRKHDDPWGYGVKPELGSSRFEEALAMVDTIEPISRRIGHALEIGCAEGLFTEQLAPRCDNLLAVDISEIALERARARCGDHPGVEFHLWDLLRDPLPLHQFDLVVVMGVLDNFVRIWQLKLLRERLVDLVEPGGYLLVESTRTGGDLEDAWWRRKLHRGRWLNAFVAQHEALETIKVRCHTICVQTLYRKKL
jgi:SAM-dependent methyltransferase